MNAYVEVQSRDEVTSKYRQNVDVISNLLNSDYLI